MSPDSQRPPSPPSGRNAERKGKTMKKYYFEIQFLHHSEIHWTRDTTVDNARDSMWDKYKEAIAITFIKEK